MSNTKDSLGDRMKGYENISRNYLTRRIPAIIRIDGKAFHTFTRGMKKPFDRILMSVMQDVMKYLCENIQGCVFGYAQSDEITLVLTDYEKITTDAWFGYNIQKMSSIAASMASDATRNSIEAVGQAHFSHSVLHKKSCNMIQEILWSQKNINWNDFPTDCKRGACCYRQPSTEYIETKTGEFIEVSRNRWTIDTDIPIFTQDRAFVEKWV